MGANILPSHILKDLSINKADNKNERKTSNFHKPLRSIINCDYNEKQIHIIEISVYHNIFITASNINFVYVYDYESCLLLGRI